MILEKRSAILYEHFEELLTVSKHFINKFPHMIDSNREFSI